GPIVPLTGNLLYPDPILPGLDLSLLPPAPAEAGVVVDALTGQGVWPGYQRAAGGVRAAGAG
ncbi:hypothetical protein, partial [Alcanivorax sp. HI0007]|uniref:hypothetical protein n=1 Tax=Alcanivorax sp. HI0007 TaxID=1822218 RepID=UPI001E374B38